MLDLNNLNEGKSLEKHAVVILCTWNKGQTLSCSVAATSVRHLYWCTSQWPSKSFLQNSVLFYFISVHLFFGIWGLTLLKRSKEPSRFLPHTAVKWLLQTHRIVTNVPEFHEQKSNQLAYVAWLMPTSCKEGTLSQLCNVILVSSCLLWVDWVYFKIQVQRSSSFSTWNEVLFYSKAYYFTVRCVCVCAPWDYTPK